MNKLEKEIALLKEGEDYEARAYLCDKLYYLITKSNNGEIAIADFTKELQDIRNLSEVFLGYMPK